MESAGVWQGRRVSRAGLVHGSSFARHQGPPGLAQADMWYDLDAFLLVSFLSFLVRRPFCALLMRILSGRIVV